MGVVGLVKFEIGVEFHEIAVVVVANWREFALGVEINLGEFAFGVGINLGELMVVVAVVVYPHPNFRSLVKVILMQYWGWVGIKLGVAMGIDPIAFGYWWLLPSPFPALESFL